jgi:hypothetical protein
MAAIAGGNDWRQDLQPKNLRPNGLQANNSPGPVAEPGAAVVLGQPGAGDDQQYQSCRQPQRVGIHCQQLSSQLREQWSGDAEAALNLFSTADADVHCGFSFGQALWLTRI